MNNGRVYAQRHFHVGCRQQGDLPDKPQAQRFQGVGEIVMMNEEHTVIRNNTLNVGDRLLLVPEHTCTTAYLYSNALVRSLDGRWEYRDQLGNERSVVPLTQ
ncbi:hypothetical protein [Paraburkholderia caledonica]|uniref:hypothetical protein n=1 Tax=Paraburkholderia caledonica TaxID=134536 RepID=UPI00351E78B5